MTIGEVNDTNGQKGHYCEKKGYTSSKIGSNNLSNQANRMITW